MQGDLNALAAHRRAAPTQKNLHDQKYKPSSNALNAYSPLRLDGASQFVS